MIPHDLHKFAPKPPKNPDGITTENIVQKELDNFEAALLLHQDALTILHLEEPVHKHLVKIHCKLWDAYEELKKLLDKP